MRPAAAPRRATRPAAAPGERRALQLRLPKRAPCSCAERSCAPKLRAGEIRLGKIGIFQYGVFEPAFPQRQCRGATCRSSLGVEFRVLIADRSPATTKRLDHKLRRPPAMSINFDRADQQFDAAGPTSRRRTDLGMSRITVSAAIRRERSRRRRPAAPAAGSTVPARRSCHAEIRQRRPGIRAARDKRPQHPEQNEVDHDGDALPPRSPPRRVGQELQLKKHQQRDRADDQADPRDQPQHQPHRRRRGHRAARRGTARRCCSAIAGAGARGCRRRGLRLKLGVECADFAGQQREMQQCVGMDDQKQRRPENEKTRSAAIRHSRKRQFDRVLEKHILVRDRAGRDREIEKYKNVADPQRAADRGGLDRPRRAAPEGPWPLRRTRSVPAAPFACACLPFRRIVAAAAATGQGALLIGAALSAAGKPEIKSGKRATPARWWHR